MKGSSRGRSNTLSKGRRCKVCIKCGKSFHPDEEDDDTKLPFSKDETSLHVDEEGFFSCGNHRRDQTCHDCFQDVVIQGHLAQANYLGHRAFKRDMDLAVKRMWKKIYLKEGDEVPWSDDDDEDSWSDDDDEEDEVPSKNAQRQVKETTSSSPSGDKACAHCGKVGNLKRCAKCKVTFYCSRSHQAEDYAKHKANCHAPNTQIPVGDEVPRSDDDEKKNEVPSDEKPLREPLNRSEQPPSSSSKMCAHCGKTDKLSMCARCKSTWYCSKDHQVADYPNHKPECLLMAEMAKIHVHRPDMKSIWNHRPARGPAATAQPAPMTTFSVISWRELEKMHPNVASGRILKVTIVSELSSSFVPQCDGRDAEGVKRRVALYTHRPPQGLRKGCVLGWRNPWFHYFFDGASGANIEHWDLPNVTVE